MSIVELSPGDEVAILPNCTAPPTDVLELAVLQYVGDVFVKLTDGRMFATIGGHGLNTDGCVVAATAEHRDALNRKSAFA